MNTIHPELLQIIKSADWYYDYTEGLQDWNKNKKTYDAAIKVMKHLTDEQVKEILQTIVPSQFHALVIKDLKPKE
jgi:hypothetical protein